MSLLLASSHGAAASLSSRRSDDEKANPNDKKLATSNLKQFSFKELKIATKNFSPDAMMGGGDFGRVYKGWVDEKTLAPSAVMGNGMAVAIRKLDPHSHQGFEEWQSEVNILGRHYHPNIISLLGYCWEGEMLILVYEFMQKGSLDNHLFRRGAIQLSWDIRLKIAIGAARGLAFLHTLEKKIVHRGCNPSNILLDENYNVRLSDFGMSMRGPCDEESFVNTTVDGTLGYLAPEYVATGNLYIKRDVYSFGVVLLELLTGLKAVDPCLPDGQQSFVEWLKPKLSLKEELETIMDVRMAGQYSAMEAFQAAELSHKCLDWNPENRPSMKEVVEENM
ncbi:hypothetical protein Ddye_009889 [Dipteronia dyeriana]|uniref:non-specific serine/threonine protein kinase n=1 Tax=Dipteronia dyeriana TaxID=168575 RepID=A0AAD9XCN2_9ROSI|nr:hypothetical protein Ddye_009889 [Dipteronia dyeriana]